MDEFITFNEAVELLDKHQKHSYRNQSIKLIDLYLNDEIDLFIEFFGQYGKRCYPCCALPLKYTDLNGIAATWDMEVDRRVANLQSESKLLIYKYVGWREVPFEEVIKLATKVYEAKYNNKPGELDDAITFLNIYSEEILKGQLDYFYESELVEMVGIYRIPHKFGSSYLKSLKQMIVYEKSEDELAELGFDLGDKAISKIESLSDELWVLCMSDSQQHIYDSGKKIITSLEAFIRPTIDTFSFKRDQIETYIKSANGVKKRPKVTERNQNIQREILEAGLYELAHNYENCLKGGIVQASRLVEAIFNNAEIHWPNGCGVNTKTKEIKRMPYEGETIERLIRSIFKKKNQNKA